MLDLDVIDSWHSELKRMNNGKKGAQYDYPDSFVQLLGYMRVYFHLPYRRLCSFNDKSIAKEAPLLPNG